MTWCGCFECLAADYKASYAIIAVPLVPVAVYGVRLRILPRVCVCELLDSVLLQRISKHALALMIKCNPGNLQCAEVCSLQGVGSFYDQRL